MDVTIHASFLPHTDPDASLAFYRDTLGFEVRNDVGYGGMRWITVGPAGQPGTSIVLHPPAADPGITDDERRTIAEMMAKGTYASIVLATADLDGAFERLQAADSAEVVQEPTEQPYGIRDAAVRDPAGNMIRLQELR
ncbi:glyoxalase [Micromonospora rosaria]|uniref:Glyoxalase n=1 Tax=Micromonospora rosaria TaxID=47874 RepID=A0A136PV87_9ACTN|nr:VOC family protein [Micromonospora rosaria]KXK62322.1 glyoxalase [Micromonospora rosaria]